MLFSAKNGCTVSYCHNCFNKKDAVQRGDAKVGEMEAGRGGQREKGAREIVVERQ